MPLYDFQCQECKHIFEVLTNSSRLDEAFSCPKCFSKQTKHVFKKANIQINFRGPGFHNTDYK